MTPPAPSVGGRRDGRAAAAPRAPEPWPAPEPSPRRSIRRSSSSRRRRRRRRTTVASRQRPRWPEPVPERPDAARRASRRRPHRDRDRDAGRRSRDQDAPTATSPAIPARRGPPTRRPSDAGQADPGRVRPADDPAPCPTTLARPGPPAAGHPSPVRDVAASRPPGPRPRHPSGRRGRIPTAPASPIQGPIAEPSRPLAPAGHAVRPRSARTGIAGAPARQRRPGPRTGAAGTRRPSRSARIVDEAALAPWPSLLDDDDDDERRAGLGRPRARLRADAPARARATAALMERVAFIVEETGERIDCLLNPDTVVVRRHAGLRRRRTAGGIVTGTNLADDPLMATGGGRTELELELLFDVTIDPDRAADRERPGPDPAALVSSPRMPRATRSSGRRRWSASSGARPGTCPTARGVRRPSGSSGSRRPACRSGRGSTFG